MRPQIRAGLRQCRWPALVAGVLTAVLVYVFLNAFALIRWEAIGVIRIGKTIGANWLDTDGLGTGATKEVLLMPVSLTVEYMSHPSFRDNVKERIKLGRALQVAGTGGESYRVRELISGNIEIRVRATSRECAQEFINQIVAELKSSHDAIYRERIARIELEIERVELRLQETIRSKQGKERRVLSTVPKAHGEQLSEKDGQREVSEHLLEAYRHVLEERLDRSLSYPTDLFAPVVVSIDPVEPNWVMHGIYSLLSGVLAALAVVVVSLSLFAGYLCKGEKN